MEDYPKTLLEFAERFATEKACVEYVGLTMPQQDTKRAEMNGPHASLLTDHDVYLFKEGSHFRLYDKLGSHPVILDGTQGTYFAVWAPNA